MAARGETQVDVEVSTLVVPAWRLRWQAPELALVLGERALALAAARRDEADRLKAEALVVFASNRIGRGVRIADRALDALKAAETAAEHQTAWLLRIELAGCARSVGAPLTGFAAVRPVLEAQGVPYALRAAALVEASECIVTVGRGDEPAHALNEADRLYAADTILDLNTKLLLRGLLRAVAAAQLRRWGDIPAAIDAAREGLELLNQADPAADSGQARGRLTLELVCALMDADKLSEASQAGTPLLERPVRAPSASTSGWLRLALATRVHLPAGRIRLAREMLREAATSAERHQLDTLLAESLLALAHVHEVSGELTDALTNLRAAHAAERRRARAVYSVRTRLAAEFSGVHRQPSSLHQQLADLLRSDGGPPRPPAADEALPADLKQQLRQWRPVQVRKGDGLKVKRVRRAAEDMTVEGLSAARAHAADRWRMVQPFGEPEDKASDPVDQQPSDRTVPAAGLIASAGAMISGRRRAARVAAGDIEDDDTPQTPEPSSPSASPQPESVMDMLKAAGLRQGGRRRAKDPDDDPAEPQQWRVEAPAHLRSSAEPDQPTPPDLLAPDPLPHNYFDPTTAVQPVVGPDGLPSRPPRSSYTTPYGQEPAEPHIDPPTPDSRPARPSGLAAAFAHGPDSPPTDPDGPALFGQETEPRPDTPTFEPGSTGPQRFSGLGAAFGQAQPGSRSDTPAFDFVQSSSEPQDLDGPGFDSGQAAETRSEAPGESRPDGPSFNFGQTPAESQTAEPSFDFGHPQANPSTDTQSLGPSFDFGRDQMNPGPDAENRDFGPRAEDRRSDGSGFDYGRPMEESRPDGPGFDVGQAMDESRTSGPGFDSGRASEESRTDVDDFGRATEESRPDRSGFDFGGANGPGFDFGRASEESRSGGPGVDFGRAATDLPADGSGFEASDAPASGFEVPGSDPFGTRARFEALAFEPPSSDEQPGGFEAPSEGRAGRRSSGLAAAFGRPESRIPAPQPEREAEPDPDPEPVKRPVPEPIPEPPAPDQPPVPDPVPSVPIPDEVPTPPEPDLLSSSFLSSADIEDEPPAAWQSFGREPGAPQSDWVQLAQRDAPASSEPSGFGAPESAQSRHSQPGQEQDQLGYTELGYTQLGYGQSEPDQPRQPWQVEQSQPDLSQPGLQPGQPQATGAGQASQIEPSQFDRGQAGPGEFERAHDGPGQFESGQAGPGQFESGQAGVGQSQSGQAQADMASFGQPPYAQSDLRQSEQAQRPDTAQAGQTQVDPVHAEQTPADPSQPAPFLFSAPQDGYNSPATGQGGYSQPDRGQGVQAPSAAQAAQTHPGAEQAASIQPGSAATNAGQPSTGQPSAATNSGQPGAGQPGAGQPSAGQPSAGLAEAAAKDPSLPSSRRKTSDMGLAELLAEALVAYETGKRDEEQEGRDPESTGPIKPVEVSAANPVEPAIPDNETTGPIRRVEESPFGGWTLPGS